MPFHSGEGTNGIPAESVAAGGEQRLFCDADYSCLPPSSCTRSLSPPHTYRQTQARCTQRHTVTFFCHLQNVRLYMLRNNAELYMPVNWRRMDAVDGDCTHCVAYNYFFSADIYFHHYFKSHVAQVETSFYDLSLVRCIMPL